MIASLQDKDNTMEMTTAFLVLLNLPVLVIGGCFIATKLFGIKPRI